MTQLPVLEDLAIDGYGMYPGGDGQAGLSVHFEPGLTLVIGANGLGKSTLVGILYRALTGPFELQGMNEGGVLGGRRIGARPLNSWETQTFGLRVTDGARDARATLRFKLGDETYEVCRSLRDLSLVSFGSASRGTVSTSEDAFQQEMTSACGVNNFGEWILLLRLLVFYFEDRRALVWDKSAQLQLLRILFLSPELSSQWANQFRDILQLDSLVRNETYTLNREERSVTRTESALTRAPEIRQQIELLDEAQQADQGRLDAFNEAHVEANNERESALLANLRAEQQLEDARRTRERLELLTLEASFPEASATARYIVAQLISTNTCLTCSSDVPAYAESLRTRIAATRCPVCDSELDARERDTVAEEDLAASLAALQRAEAALEATKERRTRADAEYAALVEQIHVLNQRVSARDGELLSLARRLPPEETEIRERRDSLLARKGRLATDKEHLARMRTTFGELQEGANRIVAESAEAVKSSFEDYARDFLFEECALSWVIYRDRVGESGPLVDFPAYQLDMSGASFDTLVRRSGPEAVSESQREFIDLAFKMALVSVAAGDAGTIIIDAPESSLDAVFVTRAADVLTRFAQSSPAKRLVITSNLIDGDLIPELLRGSAISSPSDDRVVDLLGIAAPTAAIRERPDQYAEVRALLFARAAGA